jgi:hypothetical protein
VTENPVSVSQALTPERPVVSPRRLILPLGLAQFIGSFAGSNMNVMINDISDDLDTTVKGVPTTITRFRSRGTDTPTSPARRDPFSSAGSALLAATSPITPF